MESGDISKPNTVYVLNPSFKYGNADMMNFLMKPTAIKADHKKNIPKDTPKMKTKSPQTADEHSAETFNDRTRKSLLKINLFIKRLKWFNIFSEVNLMSMTKTTMTTNEKKTTDISQKCNKFLNTKKTLSSKEMYREAAKLLGIDCSLSSSCRCLNYECQSHYFDYDESTEQKDEDSEEDSEDLDSDSDTDSYSSEFNDPDQYITNCYLIHTEELCECCQMQNERQHPSSSFSDIDLSFNTFLS